MSRSRQTNLLLFLFVAMIVSILTLNDIQTGRFTLNNNNWQRNTAFSSKRRSIEIRNAIQYTELPPFIDEIKSPTSDIIIDTISMGNKGNITNGKLMLQSQKETWVKATPGARWFFAATEDICFPECLAQNVSSQEREFVCNLEQQDSVNPKGDRPLFWSGEIMRSQSERSQGQSILFVAHFSSHISITNLQEMFRLVVRAAEDCKGFADIDRCIPITNDEWYRRVSGLAIYRR